VHFLSRSEYFPIQEQCKLDTEVAGGLPKYMTFKPEETEGSYCLGPDAILFGRSLPLFWKKELPPSLGL
jgi:hypothetical protein